MKVDISYNNELNGIELRFSEKPSPDVINEVKRKMGFKYSRRQNLWWATRTEQREEFAKGLQAALEGGETSEAISITVEPSHEPSEENIKHRKFSYVTIYYKDLNGEGMTDKFVLFEPSKNLAIDIATQFGKNTYGESFEKVYVYPRNYVREAKKLLAAGKIIKGTGNKPATPKQPEQPKPTPSNPTPNKIALSDYKSFTDAKAFALAIWKENYPDQGTGLIEAYEWKLTEIPIESIPENSAIKEGKISQDIVKHWEKQIEAGKTPPVIVKTFEGAVTDLYDGSHKFLAYRNLDYKQVPALVSSSSDDTKFFFTDKYIEAIGGKHSVKKILLSTESVSRVADFTKAKELTSWKAANKDSKSLVGQVSDVYYQVHWNDGNVVQGYVDLEPPSFFNNIDDVLSDHLLTYFTNLSKHTPDGIAGQEDIDHAKYMLKHYRFWDFNTESEEGKTWVVYDSLGKIDSLQISEKDAVDYINRRPEFGRDKMNYERMSTRKAHTLWDKQQEASNTEIDDSPAEPANKHTPVPDDGDTWVVYDSNGKIDSLQISEDAAKKYIGRRPAFSQDKMSYEQMTTKKAYRLYDEQKARKELEPGQLTTKHKLEILSEFKRSLDNQKLDLSGDELRSNFGHWFRIGYSNIASEEDNVWQEYETVKSITNPDPNEKQIPEKDYRLFFIRFTEYAEKEIDNEEDRITLKAFTDWLEKNYANINNADKEGLKKYYADFINTLEKNRKKIDNLSRPKKQQPYSGNYTKILKLAPKLIEHLDQGYRHGLSSKGAESGNMDVSLNVLYKDSKGAYIIALSHFYKEHGELKTDLDMEVRVDPNLQMVEALTYQDGLGIFQKVYHEEDGKMLVNTKLKKQLNSFLRKWLTNILDAKHKIVWSEDSKEESESNSGVIGRTNDFVYENYEDFAGDVVYQIEIQGEMTTSDAQGMLMMPHTESHASQRFIEIKNPTPVDAKNVAAEVLELAENKQETPKSTVKSASNSDNVQQAVRQFIDVLTDIEIDVEDDTQDETLIATSRLELEDAMELDESELINEVKRVIEEINEFGIEDTATKKDVDKAIRTVEKALNLKQSKPKKKNAHDLNKEIKQFVNDKDAKGEAYTTEDKAYISQYSGSGGLAKKGASGKGLLYEYYTSDEIVKLMWGLAKKYGYTNGAVLEPSCGTGNFLKYVPTGSMAVGYEINSTAKRIAEILYPSATIHEKSFESLFFKGNIHLKDDFDKSGLFDLVIGNPPYGDFSGKYAGMGEKKWTKATKYEEYFITRGLDLLKPGGLLIYIIPSSFLTTSLSKVKEKIAEKSEPLVDAYKLPTGMFTTTDIGTDIVVFRKK